MSRHRAPATGAPEDAGVGPVLGWVAGEPVPRVELDERLAALRHGPRAATLPQSGSAEDRQLARWVTQVILTERLCEHAARERGLTIVDSGPPARLDRRAAVELGSITAAAYGGNAAVRAMYDAIAADVPTPEPVTDTTPPQPAAARYRLRHGLYADEDTARLAVRDDLAPMGDVRLDELPHTLAAALTDATAGDVIGPVASGLGWHVAHVEEVLPATDPVPDLDAARANLHGPAARRAFAHWLDERRADLIDLVPGLEHPGDPRQPDNHHRH